jgi:hypothetical protein
MNIAIDIKQFDPAYISFSDIKKNNIINGEFSKIIYGDANITFNGLYIYFQVIPNHIVSYIDTDERTDELGAGGRKNHYSIFYLDSNNFNLTIVNELSAIEHNIIEYYKDLYKINKASVYQLKTQLQTGNIKIYKNEPVKGTLDFTGDSRQHPERRTQSDGGIKKYRSAIHHYYTNAFTNMSLKEAEDAGIRKEMKNYLLKVSGIWENKFSVGITYKISELGSRI